jgi:hypothetical protein
MSASAEDVRTQGHGAHIVYSMSGLRGSTVI